MLAPAAAIIIIAAEDGGVPKRGAHGGSVRCRNRRGVASSCVEKEEEEEEELDVVCALVRCVGVLTARWNQGCCCTGVPGDCGGSSTVDGCREFDCDSG